VVLFPSPGIHRCLEGWLQPKMILNKERQRQNKIQNTRV
jgi:hypothetical protein